MPRFALLWCDYSTCLVERNRPVVGSWPVECGVGGRCYYKGHCGPCCAFAIPKPFCLTSAAVPHYLRSCSEAAPHYIRTASALLPNCFRTASALLPKTASTLLPHCFRTASALLLHCFRTASALQRCALAGDQVGQGHAVGCEAGKLCKLLDTVLKGVQALAGRNTGTYDAAMTPLVR